MSQVAAASDGAPKRDLDLLVLKEQVELVYSRSFISNFVMIPFGLLVVWALYDVRPHAILWGWYGAKLVSTLARFALAVRYRRTGRDRPQISLRLLQWALALDGLLLGLIGLLPPMGNEALSALAFATVLAGASMAYIVLLPHFVTTLCYAIPLVVPTAVFNLVQGGTVHVYCGIGGIVFLALFASFGRRAAAHTRDMLRIRFQMDELVEQREWALALAEDHSAAKSRFLATMSHEMRTPLNGMLGLLQVLLRRERPEDERAQLALMNRSGEHLVALINEVLDFARIEAGRLELQDQPFDFGQVLQDVVSLMAAKLAGRGLRLEANIDLPPPRWVRGDAARVRQVLHNLIGNACKFTDRGWVHVRALRSQGRLRVEVEDTGIGIPADEMPRLFTAFHQGDGSFARRHAGTGLGLAISRQLARAMSGEVRCERTGAGGSLFSFEAALAPCEVPAAAPDLLPPGEQGLAARILVVEDNPINAYVVKIMLEELGASVELAQDGAAGVEAAHRRAPDLILMDCQMPLMDGFEATRLIRAAERRSGARRLPIIAFTANALEEDRRRCLDAGMDDHMAKPVRMEALRATIERWLPGTSLPSRGAAFGA
jgi:two-component system, sensor histidine kinase